MSRHTTGYTMNPRYRARNEIRNRLQRLVEEASTTADSFGAFDMPDTEMWKMVAEMAAGMADSLVTANEIDRRAAHQTRQDARRTSAAGYELPDLGGAQ